MGDVRWGESGAINDSLIDVVFCDLETLISPLIRVKVCDVDSFEYVSMFGHQSVSSYSVSVPITCVER